MNNFMKGLVFMAVLMYIVSPVDVESGPVDDWITALLGLAANKQLSSK